MPLSSQARALCFDIFGTTVQWRPSVTKALKEACQRALRDPHKSLSPALRARASALTDDDWDAMAEDWRASYRRFTTGFDPSHGFVTIDQHFYDSLVEMFQQRQLDGLLTESGLHELVLSWHRLGPWPDTVKGLKLLSSKFRTVTLSNSNVSLMEDLVRYGHLPFTDVLCAENFGEYKPSPGVYLGAANRLNLDPSQCVMVAAHLADLKGAKACGFGTIYVERYGEEKGDPAKAIEEGHVDLAIYMGSEGFIGLAGQLGIPTASNL